MPKKSIWTTKQKEIIEECFKGWLEAMTLLPQTVSFEFHEGKVEEGENGTGAFSIDSLWPYRSVRLDCYPIASEMGRDSIELCLIHECVHIILAPIQKTRKAPWLQFRDNLEMVTEHIAHYIHWMYEDNKELQKQLDKKK